MLTPEVQLQRPSAYELVVTVRPKANDNNEMKIVSRLAPLRA